jgi:hypothetical protein
VANFLATHPRQRRPIAVERPADIGFDVAPPCFGVDHPDGAECGEEARVVDKQADRAEIDGSECPFNCAQVDDVEQLGARGPALRSDLLGDRVDLGDRPRDQRDLRAFGRLHGAIARPIPRRHR